VADGVPDLCMCREEMEDDTMKRPPVDKNAGVLKGIMDKIGVMTALFAVTSLIGYYIGQFVGISESVSASHSVGRTMAYLIIGLSSVVNIFNVRSHKKSLFKLGFTSNRLLFGGICFSLAALVATATVPFLMGIFHCVPLAWEHWTFVIVFSVLPLPVAEAHKWVLRRKSVTA
jgi:magnesium-transporting ATPase (P-type)